MRYNGYRMGRICANTGCDADISNDHPLAKRCTAHRGRGDRKAQTERAKANGTKAAADKRWKQAHPDKVQAKKKRYRDRKTEHERPMRELRRNVHKALTVYRKAYLNALAKALPKTKPVRKTHVFHHRYCLDCGMECTPSHRCDTCKTERARQLDRNRSSVKRANRRGYNTGLKPLKQKDRNIVMNTKACAGCGCKDMKLTIDHVVPIVQGGTNDLSNLQMLCLSCNSSKGAEADNQWRRNKFGQLC